MKILLKLKWIFLAFIIINCKDKINEKEDKTEIKASIDQDAYEEINFIIKQVKNTSDSSVYKLDNYKIILELIKEKAKIEIENNIYPIDLNFFYDISIDEAINKIKIFKDKKGNKILFIPTFGSNDESTYQLIKYKDKFLYNSTISYSTFINTSGKDNIKLSESNNSYKIIIGNKIITGSFTKKSSALSTKNTQQKTEQNNIDKDSSKTTIRSDFKTFNFSGQWKKDCTSDDEVSHLLFYDKNEAILEIYNKGKFVAKLRLNLDRNNKSLTYVGTNIIGENIDSKNIVGLPEGEVIGKVQIVGNNQITISWHGLYNDKTKQKMFVQNPFSDKESYILKRCR